MSSSPTFFPASRHVSPLSRHYFGIIAIDITFFILYFRGSYLTVSELISSEVDRPSILGEC